MDKIQIGLEQLISQEVYQQNIEGAIAEVGVYRGINASVMNHFFPDRKLYLFDTFKGFDPRDLEVEKRLGFNPSEYPRRDLGYTNIDIVMSRMPHKENIIVRKGWFPETAVGLEDETFCFVFLDTNLYQPVYEGLHWFYPRLANGGFIVVDLYNWDEFPGTRKAVCDFSREVGISYIPIPSRTGCVAIGKPLFCEE
jgi:O-methyltransferase